ncbi:MAG: HNH endonuclease [Saprospiraceae bacterium]
METPTCPICDRELGNKNISKHHLIPKSKGGKHTDTIDLHNICHQKIHSVFTEKELKDHFNTIEKIREHEEIQKFIKWVAKQDPAFYQGNRTSNRKKEKKASY